MLIGTAIDELIRHHPTLKGAVFDALKSALSAIEEMGRDFKVPANMSQWYQLRTPPPEAPASSGDVPMDVDEPATTSAPKDASQEADDDSTDDEQSKSHDTIIVAYIDILGRVRDISSSFSLV